MIRTSCGYETNMKKEVAETVIGLKPKGYWSVLGGVEILISFYDDPDPGAFPISVCVKTNAWNYDELHAPKILECAVRTDPKGKQFIHVLGHHLYLEDAIKY